MNKSPFFWQVILLLKNVRISSNFQHKYAICCYLQVIHVR